MNHSVDLFKMRRSRYELSGKLAVSEEELEKLVGEVLLQMPSAFNMQSARMVILLGEKHHVLWKITHDALKAIVPADKFEPTAQKINAFNAAYGTILYLEGRLERYHHELHRHGCKDYPERQYRPFPWR